MPTYLPDPDVDLAYLAPRSIEKENSTCPCFRILYITIHTVHDKSLMRTEFRRDVSH